MTTQKDNAVCAMQDFFPNGGRDFDDVVALYDAIAAGEIPGVVTGQKVAELEQRLQPLNIETSAEEFLAYCLKAEEISGDKQQTRIKELIGWFSRYYRQAANPKWLSGHVAELCYFIIKNAEAEQRLQQPALADVMAERQRQISAEGWTPERDDQHESSEMAGAAACYARHVNARGWVYSHNPDDYQCEPESSNWPWDASWWKPTNPRRDLVKAGALILAEIERLDRAAEQVEGE